MLILTRHTGESIVIDEEKIKVVVLEVKGNQVKIGIKAKKEISVHREEVYERIREQKEKVVGAE